MATPRTSTGGWRRIRKAALAEARGSGLTNCPLCGVELDYESKTRPPNAPEVDHIVPHSLGGDDSTENVRVICGQCNHRRGNRVDDPKPPLQFKSSRRW